MNIRYIKLLLAAVTIGAFDAFNGARIEAFGVPIIATTGNLAQSHSSQYTLRQLSPAQGLSSSYGYGVVQDRDGFVWFATNNGLNRYDGYTFKIFTHESKNASSLGSNEIKSLLIAKDGTLWAAGREINKFDATTQTFERFYVSNDKAIKVLYEDRRGLLWFSGWTLGLRAFDPNTNKLAHHFVHDPTNPDTLPGDYIRAIDEDARGNLWLGTEAGLAMFSPEEQTFIRYTLPPDLPNLSQQQIYDLIVTSSGQVWMATSAGIVVFDPDGSTWQYYQHRPGQPQTLSTNQVWSVYQDSHGNIWIGTDKQGLERFIPETESFEHFPADAENPNAIPPGAISHIYEDDSGTFWLSIDNFGVSRFRPDQRRFRLYRHYGNETNLGFNNLLDLHESADGYIWVATDGGGLDRFNPQTETFEHYRHDPQDPQSLSSDSVIAINEDAQGNLWIGTWAGGLNKFDIQTQTFERYRHNPAIPNGLAGDSIFRILIDDQEQLWLSVWRNGVQRFDPDTQSYVTFSPTPSEAGAKLLNRNVNDIHQDSDGSFWFAGHDGLEKFNPATGEVRQFKISRHDDIFDIFEDDRGILWLATEDGLIKLDPKTEAFTKYGLEEGLLDQHVTGIEPDQSGQLWLGTRKGLSRFDPRTETVETYEREDGLQGPEFNRFSHVMARDGTLYFGGPNGLNAFHPDQLGKNTHIPKVIIHEFELNQQDVTLGKNAALPAHVTQLETIQLSPQHRDITFEFTSLDFTIPKHNRYRYRLVGLEDEWTEVDSTRRRARYTNLSPGQYTFWVQGSNNDGVWNEDGDQLRVIVLPPWWKTWWFRVCSGIAILMSLQQFINWRLRATHQRQQVLEKVVQDKTQALSTAHAEVLALNMDLEDRVRKRTEQLQIEIDERRQAQDQLLHMAMHDSLTQLPNRAWLMEALKQALEQSFHGGGQFALLFLDGDRFKTVNDSLGHIAGDHLLVAFAQRLRKIIPPKYSISRLGGDEFTILVPEEDAFKTAQAVAQNVILALEDPFYLDQQAVFFSVSIGIVLGPCTYTQPEQILRDADIAMYRAKAKGKARYLYFNATMRQDAMEIMQIEQDLRSAIKSKCLGIHYQPIINLDTNVVVGFEALVRWTHPFYGNISPARFIPIAEETGQIQQLGLWVFRQTCQQVADWRQELKLAESIWVSVNLSVKQLTQPDFVAQINDILHETNISGSHIKLEITETSLVENTEVVIQCLSKLQELKIDLAIDDFGTGYSSLSYLHQFPVQTLKIDRSFVQKLESGSKAEMVRATIALAHSLDLEIVAEGIETEYQKQILRDYGCEFGQGYLFAQPLDVDDAKQYLRHCNSGLGFEQNDDA